jgi:type VI secretion system protein ImpI
MLLSTDELTLTMLNPPVAGTATDFRFGRKGGSIGSAGSDSWRLSAHRTGAVPGHAEVRFADGGYCLIDRSGRTYINSASQPIGRGRRARLQQGDTIAIGVYRMRAEFGVGTADLATGTDNENLTEQPLIHSAEAPLLRVKKEQLSAAEPLHTLRAPIQDAVAFDGPPPWSLAGPDCGVNTPSEEQGNSGECRRSQAQKTGLDSRQHIGVAPLLRGLDSDLTLANSDDMTLLLEEAGQTLQAAISGLLALHQSEDSRHQVLRTRLQPIEDNPLRFAADYSSTVNTLFASQRSPVHLSAPSAVQESLASLKHHQQATGVATSQGLAAILHALSPDALLQRFRGYRRGLHTDEDENTWAWDMYRHYYQELNSSRQQGFERLFQEVFDQAYDQHVRQLQRESLL